jgi:hypothetical protein
MPENPLEAKPKISTTEFKTGLAEMGRSIRVLESEFKATAASMSDWEDNSAGLEARIKSLTGQIEIQTKKVSLIRSEYEKVAAEKGSNSKAAQDLEIRLNKETESLNKMDRELGESKTKLNAVGDASGNASKEINNMDQAVETLKAGLATVLGVITAVVAVLGALAAGAIAAGKAIADLVLEQSKLAGELVDLSNKTGISTTRLQELKYAGDQLGTTSDTITGSLSKLIRSMGEARDKETGPLAEAFNQLGVQVTDANGNLKDSETVFAEVIDKLGQIPNETDRDVLAMQLLGKGAMELNPLIKAGSDELARLSQEAHDMGAVVSEDAVAGLETFDDQIAGLTDTFAGLKMKMAAAFMGNTDPKELTQDIINLVTRMADQITENGPKILDSGQKLLQALADGFVTALPAIRPKLQLMATTIGTWIGEHLPEILLALVEVGGVIIGAAIDVGIKIIEGIAQGLINRYKILGKQILGIGTAIVDGIWQGILNAKADFENKIQAFFQGIINTAKAALGLSSPSAIFADIGANAGNSYVNSLGAALKAGTADLQKAFGSSALALNVNANGAGTGGGGNSTVNQTIFQLQALYQNQPRESLMSDIRFLQSLYGEA